MLTIIKFIPWLYLLYGRVMIGERLGGKFKHYAAHRISTEKEIVQTIITSCDKYHSDNFIFLLLKNGVNKYLEHTLTGSR